MTVLSPSRLTRRFIAALSDGRVATIEEFLAAESITTQPVADEILEALLPVEMERCLELGMRVHEMKFVDRFHHTQKQIVAAAFQDVRDEHSDQWKAFIPDPRKTDPNMVLDLFFRSTNVLNPNDYIEAETALFSEQRDPEVRLRVVKGPHAGKELVFDKTASVFVGRGEDAKLQLPKDVRCSRLHCRFEVNPPHCEVVDLKSTNGTLVNGQRVPRQTLKDKDTVQIGTTKIRVHIQEEAEASETDLPSPTFNPLLDIPEIPGVSLDAMIGKGRYGVVYTGRQIDSDRPVAVKVLSATAVPSSEELHQFINETSVAVRLKHPQIVESIDFGVHQDAPYLIMEKVETIKILERLRNLAWPHRQREACRLTTLILSGLEQAHREGIVHRDIKISNLLFSEAGGNIDVRISDFGLAVKSTGTFGSQNSICGTAAYMAPEMISSPDRINPQSDIFAAGVCLYELLSDRRPREANEINDLLFMILNEPATPIHERTPEVAPEVAEIVGKAIASDQKKRYATAEEMRLDLLAWLSEQ